MRLDAARRPSTRPADAAAAGPFTAGCGHRRWSRVLLEQNPVHVAAGGAVYDTLHVTVHPTGPDRCRVTVTGELDVVSAPDVRHTLKAAVAAHDRVDVDCGQLTFCDCTGLSALLAAAREAKAAGSELRLCAVPHTLARLLRLTHAGSAFTIEQPDVR